VPPSSSGTISAPDGRPRRRVREPTPSNRLRAHGGTSGADGAVSGAATAVPGASATVPGATVTVGGGRMRRRRRRRRKRDGIAVAMSAPTDFSEPDPLALAMCMAVGPPALIVSFDPMLEELAVNGAPEATSLRTAEPSTAGNDATTGFVEPAMAMAQEPPQLTPLASEVVSVEVASQPSKTETATRDGSPQPPEHESAMLTPPREGQPGVASGDETPSPHEAARRLAQFLDKVRVVREPPLITSPPRQRTPVRRPPPI
jgi:hypothetical protein